MSIEPTEDVDDSPVNGIISVRLGEIEPTAEVVETPDKVGETSVCGDSSPNWDNSNPCPTNPTTSAGEIAPTADVVETPVKICASLILTDPTEDVVESPVNGIKFSTPVESEPTAEVALTPAGVKTAPVKIIAEPRVDAGLGIALKIKKFYHFETTKPLTVRADFPLFLNRTPNVAPDNIQFRWVLGVGRAF